MVALPLPVPHFRFTTVAELPARVYAFFKRNTCRLLAAVSVMQWCVVATASATYCAQHSGPAHLCFAVSFGASCSMLALSIGILFAGQRLLEE
jgi:hypothetical protein